MLETIDYDGLTLTVETAETDIMRGDECVGHGVRVVGIERVKEGPVEDVAATRASDWFFDWSIELGTGPRGYAYAPHRVTDGRALAAWLTSWGGDTLLDELTEKLMARMRDDAERAREQYVGDRDEEAL